MAIEYKQTLEFEVNGTKILASEAGLSFRQGEDWVMLDTQEDLEELLEFLELVAWAKNLPKRKPIEVLRQACPKPVKRLVCDCCGYSGNVGSILRGICPECDEGMLNPEAVCKPGTNVLV